MATRQSQSERTANNSSRDGSSTCRLLHGNRFQQRWMDVVTSQLGLEFKEGRRATPQETLCHRSLGGTYMLNDRTVRHSGNVRGHATTIWIRRPGTARHLALNPSALAHDLVSHQGFFTRVQNIAHSQTRVQFVCVLQKYFLHMFLKKTEMFL